MRVALLLVQECPHADAARTLLARSLAELGLDVVVDERVGDYPSPTVLVNGVDVMTGVAGVARIPACRLDVPTQQRVLDALRVANGSTNTDSPPPAESYPAQLAVGVTRDRIAAVSPAARALHNTILRGFAANGKAPDANQLATANTGNDLSELLAQLHEHDVIRLDEHGRVRAAYPFSGVPTPHTVAIGGGPTVYAMCAIDALGIADMLSRDIAIASTDPASGQEINITVHSGRASWTPDTAVVFVGSDHTATSVGGDRCPPDTDQACAVPAADRCCGVMNFFTSTDSANTWLATHPNVTGVILSQLQALQLGNDIFGSLLDERPHATAVGLLLDSRGVGD